MVKGLIIELLALAFTMVASKYVNYNVSNVIPGARIKTLNVKVNTYLSVYIMSVIHYYITVYVYDF